MASLTFGKKKSVDMTQGNITKLIIGFALPLLLGNAFQQFYNTVDSWVVGNYVSGEAFGAVGSITPIVNLFVSFFTGMSTGCGVIVSQYTGAQKEDKVSLAVHGGFFIILCMGIVLTIVCTLLSPALIRFMNVPDGAAVEAETYLRVYCAGLIFLTVYNLCAAVLRAVGDSRRPTIYLIVTAVVNIILDLLFVIRFGWGVAGVAWATVIAEAISMVCVVIDLLREKSAIRFVPKRLFIQDVQILRQIIAIGIPAGVQTAIISFSNIFVHSYVNYFGTGFMGGYAAYMKIEKFAQLPLTSLQLSLTTFVGQNIGAGNVRRAKDGVRRTLQIVTALCLFICVLMYVFAPGLVGFFSPDEEIITSGTWVVRLMVPFTLFHASCYVFPGALRGAGESRSIMYMMVGSYVVFRQIYLYIVTHFVANTPLTVVLGIGLAWCVATIASGVYYCMNVDRIFTGAVPAESGDKIIV